MAKTEVAVKEKPNEVVKQDVEAKVPAAAEKAPEPAQKVPKRAKGDVDAWGVKEPFMTGVCIDGVWLEPILKDVEISHKDDKARGLFEKIEATSIFWGLAEGTFSVFEYHTGKERVLFVLDSKSWWVGKGEDLGAGQRRWFPGADKVPQVGWSPSIILREATCKDCILVGARNEVVNATVSDTYFYGSNITVNKNPTNLATWQVPQFQTEFKRLNLVNSSITNSDVAGISIVNSSLTDCKINRTNQEHGVSYVQDSTLHDCTFTSQTGRISIKNVYGAKLNMRVKDMLSVKNLHYPQTQNIQYLDSIQVVNAYDLAAIDFIDKKLYLVRKDLNNVWLSMEGVEPIEFPLVPKDVLENQQHPGRYPFYPSPENDVREKIKELGIKVDKQSYSGPIERDWNSDMNRRFLDFAADAARSRIGVIVALRDAARATTALGSATIPRVSDPDDF